MAERKIVVPQEMVNSAVEQWNRMEVGYTDQRHLITVMLEAALRCLSENPIVPTPEQALDMSTGGKFELFDNWELVRWGACEWQRRMFLALEPEIPEAVKAVKDLLWETAGFAGFTSDREAYNSNLIEAFRRGQKAGK